MKKYGLIVILLLIYSCSIVDNFDKSIFIPDKEDPNLPAYTELGYNTFGAKYGNSYFLSSDSSSFGVDYHGGILDLWLAGRQENNNMSLTFSFPFSPVYTYQDLVSLTGTTIDLTGASCNLIMRYEYQNEDTLIVSSGRLNFKQARILRIDNIENRAIISGTFDAQFLRNGLPEVISNGRFDLGITGIN